jgi:phosphate transport system protein
VNPSSGGSRTVFRDQMDEVRGEIVHLAGLVAEAIPRATSALLDADLDAARKLVDGDDVLDVLTLQIEEHCYHLLALQSPMASDLRAVITALRLASEIERCGDLAVNIAKAARRLYGVELESKLRGIIERMSRSAVRLFRLAVDAYADGDAGRAAALDDLDDELDDLHRAFIAAIFESHHSSGVDLRVGVQLALIGRFYERLGDHAVNIGERVQYMVTGWLPEHAGAARAAARGEVEAHAEETIHLEDYGESNGSTNGSGTGPD